MTEASGQNGTATRRGVLLGAGALGAGAILAACGGEDPAPSTPDGDDIPTDPPAATDGIKVSDVAVGGGVILKEQNLVVTQPQAGEFQAFSATCTHQNCVVANISDGKINCTCHGSQFNVADGSVARGPATRPLTKKNVTVNGDTLTVS
jgi:Rieske Fe-S protein